MTVKEESPVKKDYSLTPEELKEIREEGKALRKEMAKRIKEMHTFTAEQLHTPTGGKAKL